MNKKITNAILSSFSAGALLVGGYCGLRAVAPAYTAACEAARPLALRTQPETQKDNEAIKDDVGRALTYGVSGGVLVLLGVGGFTLAAAARSKPSPRGLGLI